MVDFILDRDMVYRLSLIILITALMIIGASIIFGKMLYREIIDKMLDYLDRFPDPTKSLIFSGNS
jgi:hypothetical protein